MSLVIKLPRDLKYTHLVQLMADNSTGSFADLRDLIMGLVGLGLQSMLFGPLLRTCQRRTDTGFFHFLMSKGRVRDVTQASMLTVSLFSVHRRDRVLTGLFQY